MNTYELNVNTNNIGGYFSSEQLDLLSIVQCESYEELIDFVKKCSQLKGKYLEDDYKNFLMQDFEELKREVFKKYQETLTSHNSNSQTILENSLNYLGIKNEDIEVIKKVYESKTVETTRYVKEYIKNKYPKNYEEIFKQIHQFISVERDQIKNPNLYGEFVLLNENLANFDTLLVGSGKPEIVINEFLEEDKRFDFYFAERDLDFAYRNNKHIRFHSLLTKNACEKLFNGKSKSEIIAIMKEYVKATIDFINNYNETHTLLDGTPVIQAIDLFNEIVSFDPNDKGEYENIWESEYGITIKDICEIFEYAKTYKKAHESDNINYLYNEPFLENPERRQKVIATLKEINDNSPGLIDTLGSQMHITFDTPNKEIEKCFKDFRELQEDDNFNLQITEFDLSLSKRNVLSMFNNPQVTYEQIYSEKQKRIADISEIINNSMVKLDGISYWSLTDKIDCNLERIRDNLLKDGVIDNIDQIPTVCGGLMPTYMQSLNLKNTSGLKL